MLAAPLLMTPLTPLCTLTLYPPYSRAGHSENFLPVFSVVPVVLVDAVVAVIYNHSTNSYSYSLLYAFAGHSADLLPGVAGGPGLQLRNGE